jgi:hypothetical protein
MTMSVRIDEHFDCTQGELWAAITDADRLSEWLGGSCVIEPRVGGAVVFDLPADGVVATGVVRACEPPGPGFRVAMVEHTFVPADNPELASVCMWAAVTDDGTGCDLHFTHDGFGEVDRPKLADAWGRRLGHPVPLASARRPTTSEDEAISALRAARTILLVSFIGPEVPVTLTAAGFRVVAKTGPGPDEWVSCAVAEGALVTTPLPRPPENVDLVHLDVTHAFDEYVACARSLGAATFWFHSARTLPPAPADNRGCWVPAAQSARQREIVEAAGMTYIDDHYIADTARRSR